jgi:hypothetical protein
MNPDDVAVPMSLDVLEAEICRWSANLTAAEARWLGLLAEFDRRGGWQGTGCLSCAAWLAWQTSLDLRTAHEKVRVARALEAFPPLAEHMATGALTYAKVRALTRIATPENVQDLITFALAATSNQVERFVTAFRRHEPDHDAAEARAHAERGLWVRNEGPLCTIRLEVPADFGAVIVGCIDMFLHDTDMTDGLRARRSDALLAMASFAVAHYGEEAEVDHAYLATVHLTPNVMDDAGEPRAGAAGTEGLVDVPVDAQHRGAPHAAGVCCGAPGDGLGADPVAVPRKSARRMLCDAVVEGLIHRDGRDAVVGQGRRTVSRRLKRALRLRDNGCRFPGCEHMAWLDAHHIVHWLDLGRTVPGNLLCLCRRHHRLMHEGGWTITGDPNSDVWFHSPDGAVLAAQPLRVEGAAEPVEGHGRSADDGRCGWWGDKFDLEFTLDVICDNEWLRQGKPSPTRTSA